MKSVYSDVAYSYIRKRILNGEFPPGQGLPTEVLAKQIGVSRAPVRDALRLLEADGLVRIRARQGASVKEMTAKEFREVCDLRLALECYAAGLAAQNRTAADLRDIRAPLDAMAKLTEETIAADKDVKWSNELARDDVRFHLAIIAAAHSELMQREILRLHLVNRVVALPSGEGQPTPSKVERNRRMRFVLSVHESIYQAIARGDAPAARMAMEGHLRELMESSLRALSRQESGRIVDDLTMT
ncbi:MAG: GntR family transcriptional regulator [Opitutaceae bacterium]|nr:GntR family transcriptional regulator [Opitutaceae bacterium]